MDDSIFCELLVHDWHDDDFLKQANELLNSKGLGRLKGLGCFLADGIELSRHQTKGLVVVATSDLPAGKVVLVERSLLPFTPPCLYPRNPSEVPYSHWGFPFYWLPSVVFYRFPVLLQYLRMASNSFIGGVFAVGSRVSHSCAPNAERYMHEKFGATALITTVPITKGSEITVQYSNVVAFPSRKLRRCWLFWWRGFWCSCERCSGLEQDSYKKLRALLLANSDPAPVETTITEALYSHRGNLELNASLLSRCALDKSVSYMHFAMTLSLNVFAWFQMYMLWTYVLPTELLSYLPNGYWTFAIGVIAFVCSDPILSVVLSLEVFFYDAWEAARIRAEETMEQRKAMRRGQT